MRWALLMWALLYRGWGFLPVVSRRRILVRYVTSSTRWVATTPFVEDTIFALSSGHSQATAVAVIRISGPHAVDILRNMTSSAVLPKPRVATLRTLRHPVSPHLPLDQALVLYFPEPHSFTGEHVVELHTHGSRAVIDGLMETLSEVGARMAEPGEFTQRAFAAGKLDLLQVEALADLLTADTSSQRQQALQQLQGSLTETYTMWRDELIAGLAHAEAVIDFGDDETLDGNDDSSNGQWNVWGSVTARMQSLKQSMQHHLADARRGELVRQGVQLCIVGPPNAGKSSLFNLLAQCDAAIVSPTAGTTRDVLSVSLNLGGVKCVLCDTAGVRNATDDEIEWQGIQRATRTASQADVIVAMVDVTNPTEGLEILQSLPTTANVLVVYNKCDLQHPERIMIDAGQPTFSLSCTTQQGLDDLVQNLTTLVLSRVSRPDAAGGNSSEGALITRTRHRQHVQAAMEALERFEQMSHHVSTVDLAAEELRLATSELGRVTGAVDVEDVLDKLFADFCIGK